MSPSSLAARLFSLPRQSRRLWSVPCGTLLGILDSPEGDLDEAPSERCCRKCPSWHFQSETPWVHPLTRPTGQAVGTLVENGASLAIVTVDHVIMIWASVGKAQKAGGVGIGRGPALVCRASRRLDAPVCS